MDNKTRSIIKKYRYGLPSLPNIVSNNDYRILCKAYKIRFRLPKINKKNCCEHKSRTIQKTSANAIKMYTKLQCRIEDELEKTRAKIIESKSECPICYCAFDTEEMSPWFVSCMHAYCLNCLKTIMQYSNKCSMCREPIYSEYDYKVSRLSLSEYEWALKRVEEEALIAQTEQQEQPPVEEQQPLANSMEEVQVVESTHEYFTIIDPEYMNKLKEYNRYIENCVYNANYYLIAICIIAIIIIEYVYRILFYPYLIIYLFMIIINNI